MKVTKQETLYHKDHGATLKHKCGKKDSSIVPFYPPFFFFWFRLAPNTLEYAPKQPEHKIFCARYKAFAIYRNVCYNPLTICLFFRGEPCTETEKNGFP